MHANDVEPTGLWGGVEGFDLSSKFQASVIDGYGISFTLTLFSLQNKEFVLLDIRSSNLANFGGPIEIFLDLSMYCLMMMI